jgi:hypothetical protein
MEAARLIKSKNPHSASVPFQLLGAAADLDRI